MPTVPVNAVMEVIQVGYSFGSEVQNRIYVRNLQLKQTYAEFALRFRDTIINQLCMMMCAHISFQACKVREHTPQGPTDYEVVPIGHMVGRHGGALGAHQVAAIIQLKVKSEGAKRDGRIYLPGIPNDAFINNSWSNSYLSPFLSMCNSLKNRFGKTATENDFRWLVKAKSVTGVYEFFTVTEFKLQNQPGIQRRRRNETI